MIEALGRAGAADVVVVNRTEARAERVLRSLAPSGESDQSTQSARPTS